ncbi:hypothetical protein BH23ACT5_BH23ACT5_03210 [soil metagenome]
MRHDLTPVILSGGSGNRLWPLSVPGRPKQLQALVGTDSMIQATATRTQGIDGLTPPLVVCNDAQVDEIRSQLGAVGAPPDRILVEPVGRNTAPAVAAAALSLSPETIMAVFPADHVITDTTAFHSALISATEAAQGGRIVTFGIVPSRPDTGFGYIEAADLRGGVADVVRFVEKPDADTARSYLDSGRFLWNSGMFVFAAGAIRAELERHVPQVLEAVAAAVDGARTDGDAVYLADGFADAEAISIDHAVMERTDRAVVVPLDAGWSDVGSWQALWEVSSPGGETVTVGNVYAVDVAGSYLRAESRRLAVIGLDDVVVVETPEAVLVMSRHRAQEVRSAAEWFVSQGVGDT